MSCTQTDQVAWSMRNNKVMHVQHDCRNGRVSRKDDNFKFDNAYPCAIVGDELDDDHDINGQFNNDQMTIGLKNHNRRLFTIAS